jgi:8-oxo-dGTP diphosphatase
VSLSRPATAGRSASGSPAWHVHFAAIPIRTEAYSKSMKVRVLASVVQRESRLLVCLRPPHKRHGGLWEFPGGKLEPGETDLQAARRELEEELGVHVTGVGPVEYSVEDPGSDFVIDFLPVKIEGEPVCLEHSDLAWVTEEELDGLDLAPSDRRYALHRLGERSTDGD